MLQWLQWLRSLILRVKDLPGVADEEFTFVGLLVLLIRYAFLEVFITALLVLAYAIKLVVAHMVALPLWLNTLLDVLYIFMAASVVIKYIESKVQRKPIQLGLMLGMAICVAAFVVLNSCQPSVRDIPALDTFDKIQQHETPVPPSGPKNTPVPKPSHSVQFVKN